MDNVNKEKREVDQDVLNKVSSAAARRQILCRIQRALSLSLHVISRDHTQLPGQLLGRLMSFDDPWIGGLLAQAGETKAYTWLRPLSPFSSKAEGPLEGIMSGHVSGVKGIVVEPDGQTVLSAARDGSIREWDLVDLKEKRFLTNHDDYAGRKRHSLEGGVWLLEHFDAIALTPDGRYLVSCSNGQGIAVWDLISGTVCRKMADSHKARVSDIAVSPDGSRIISASNQQICIWDLADGVRLRSLDGHQSLVLAVDVSPDGKFIVSGSRDRSVKVWVLERGEEIHSMTGHRGPILSVAVTPEGKRAVSGSSDGTLRLWDLLQGKEIRTFSGHEGYVNVVAVSPDGNLAFSGGRDRTIKVWDLKTGEELRTFTGHLDGVLCVAAIQDGEGLISSSEDKTLRTWSLREEDSLGAGEEKKSPIRTVAALPDGRGVVVGSEDGVVRLWNLADRKPIEDLTRHSGPVLTLAVSRRGDIAVSGSDDKTLKVCRIKDRKEILTLAGHEKRIRTVAISPDGRYVLSGADDNTIRLWDLKKKKLFRTAHVRSGTHRGAAWTGGIRSVAFSPNGKSVYCACHDREIIEWEASRLRETRRLGGGIRHISRRDEYLKVAALAVSGDGRFAVSCSEDETMKIWDIERGQLDHDLEQRILGGISFAFSPVGRRAVSCTRDGILRCWNVGDWKISASLDCDSRFSSCAIGPGGSDIIVGGESGEVFFFRLEEPARITN